MPNKFEGSYLAGSGIGWEGTCRSFNFQLKNMMERRRKVQDDVDVNESNFHLA